MRTSIGSREVQIIFASSWWTAQHWVRGVGQPLAVAME
jgi:hypothetical protein